MNQFFHVNESFDLIWFDLIKIEAFASFEWIVRIWICVIVHFVRCLNETLTVWRQPCVASYFSHGLVCITLYNRISMSHPPLPLSYLHVFINLLHITLLLLRYSKEEKKKVCLPRMLVPFKRGWSSSWKFYRWMVELVALMYEK